MARGLIGDMFQAFGAVGLPRIKRAVGVITRRIPVPAPVLLVGPGAAQRLGEAIAGFGHRRLLLVTDTVISGLGLAEPLTDALAAGGVAWVVFAEVTADAPIPMVERGLAIFKTEACDAILAIGGGSVMDTAKVIGLAAANALPLRELAGYFRGRYGPVPIYAVPTTAGTGSEVSVAAVISDPVAGRKFVVIDTRLVPEMAALDGALMLGLPPDITAATGMDAFTHAVEAFLGDWATPYTDRMALAAAAAIWQYLPKAVAHGQDLVARERLAWASACAGMAFTRANVGNVHAIAHQLGAHCHAPHGLANALMLVPVLRWYLPAASARMAALARRLRLEQAGDDDAALAARLVDAVQALNDGIGIPRTLAGLREADLPGLAAAACHEADLNYPVPRRMSPADAEALLRQVLPAPPGRARARTKALARK